MSGQSVPDEGFKRIVPGYPVGAIIGRGELFKRSSLASRQMEEEPRRLLVSEVSLWWRRTIDLLLSGDLSREHRNVQARRIPSRKRGLFLFPDGGAILCQLVNQAGGAHDIIRGMI